MVQRRDKTKINNFWLCDAAHLFQSSKLIMDIATCRLNQPRANAVKII